VHGVRAGFVGAQATPGFSAPTVVPEGEREREREELLDDCVGRERKGENKLWMILITGLTWDERT
jgi:hypothetical protein